MRIDLFLKLRLSCTQIPSSLSVTRISENHFWHTCTCACASLGLQGQNTYILAVTQSSFPSVLLNITCSTKAGLTDIWLILWMLQNYKRQKSGSILHSDCVDGNITPDYIHKLWVWKQMYPLYTLTLSCPTCQWNKQMYSCFQPKYTDHKKKPNIQRTNW